MPEVKLIGIHAPWCFSAPQLEEDFGSGRSTPRVFRLAECLDPMTSTPERHANATATKGSRRWTLRKRKSTRLECAFSSSAREAANLRKFANDPLPTAAVQQAQVGRAESDPEGDGYDWEILSIAGRAFNDSGSGACRLA